jgi:Domain of Unknown Function with PDB structure (DUF3857)
LPSPWISLPCAPETHRSRPHHLPDLHKSFELFPFGMTLLRPARLLVAGLALCILTAQQAKAGAGAAFQPVSPDELKITSEPLAPGASAIILYRQVDRDDNDRTSEDNYIRIKILTEEGRKYADVEIPFLKDFQDVVKIKARTTRPDGSIANFEGKAFEKNLVKARGVKYLAKTFTLPDVQVGSVIEYSYTTTLNSSRLYDSHWILSDELFTKKAEFSLKPYKGDYQDLSLRWSWQHLPPDTPLPAEGHDHMIRMEVRNIPPFETEDYMPPRHELMSRVDFIYELGVNAKDEAAYWKQMGKAWNVELERFVGKPKAMEKVVEQIVSPNDSQEVKLRKIYARVQQIRNTSYEREKTTQEEKREKIKSIDKAEDVWKRGYGNDFQLTWLFLGLVRAAGIEAYGCWVSDRKEYFFNPKTMQSEKLDTNVVLVKLNGKDLYLDPGVIFTPFGLLTWSETGVAGLRLDADGGTWIRTTIPEPSQSRVERVGKLKLSDTNDLEGKLTVTYTGLNAMYHRMEERDSDDVTRKKYLEELVTSQIGVPSEAELTNKPDWTSSETSLIAEYSLKIPGWASNAGKRIVIPAAIFTAGEKGVFEHANRVHFIYFDYAYEKTDDLTVELPPGWQVSSVPAPKSQDEKVLAYNLKVEQSPGAVRLTRKFTVDALLADPKFYPTFRNFFQNLRTSDGMQVIVQPAETQSSK